MKKSHRSRASKSISHYHGPKLPGRISGGRMPPKYSKEWLEAVKLSPFALGGSSGPPSDGCFQLNEVIPSSGPNAGIFKRATTSYIKSRDALQHDFVFPIGTNGKWSLFVGLQLQAKLVAPPTPNPCSGSCVQTITFTLTFGGVVWPTYKITGHPPPSYSFSTDKMPPLEVFPWTGSTAQPNIYSVGFDLTINNGSLTAAKSGGVSGLETGDDNHPIDILHPENDKIKFTLVPETEAMAINSGNSVSFNLTIQSAVNLGSKWSKKVGDTVGTAQSGSVVANLGFSNC